MNDRRLSIAAASSERGRQIALGMIDYAEVCVIAEVSDAAGNSAAAQLRRAGVVTRTFLSGSLKTQTKKSIAEGAEYILFVRPDGYTLRDVATRLEQRITDVASEVLDTIIYDWRLTCQDAWVVSYGN